MRALDQVSPHVWVATSPTWFTTTTVIVAGDGRCLLVDPALTPEEITALAAEIAGRGWQVAAAFSTHPHWDHLLWSTALPDVSRWATATAATWAQQRSADIHAEAARDLPGFTWDVNGGTRPLGPDQTELPWPGPRAVVVETGAHAAGHASLLLPEDRVLVAGDLLSDIEVPLLDPDAADPVGDYRRVLQKLAPLVADCDVVVPGHGRVTDGAGAGQRIAADLRYLDAVVAGTAPADGRLAEPRIRADHEEQTSWLSRR